MSATICSEGIFNGALERVGKDSELLSSSLSLENVKNINGAEATVDDREDTYEDAHEYFSISTRGDACEGDHEPLSELDASFVSEANESAGPLIIDESVNNSKDNSGTEMGLVRGNEVFEEGSDQFENEEEKCIEDHAKLALTEQSSELMHIYVEERLTPTSNTSNYVGELLEGINGSDQVLNQQTQACIEYADMGESDHAPEKLIRTRIDYIGTNQAGKNPAHGNIEYLDDADEPDQLPKEQSLTSIGSTDPDEPNQVLRKATHTLIEYLDEVDEPDLVKKESHTFLEYADFSEINQVLRESAHTNIEYLDDTDAPDKALKKQILTCTKHTDSDEPNQVVKKSTIECLEEVDEPDQVLKAQSETCIESDGPNESHEIGKQTNNEDAAADESNPSRKLQKITKLGKKIEGKSPSDNISHDGHNLSISMRKMKCRQCKNVRVCPECHCEYSKTLPMHLQRGPKNQACSECGLLLHSTCALKAHLRLHSGETGPAVCPDCGIVYVSNNVKYLHQHFLKRCLHMHRVVLYKCPDQICVESFRNVEALHQHMLQHVSSAYRCKVCNLLIKNGKKRAVDHIIMRHRSPTRNTFGYWMASLRLCCVCGELISENLTEHIVLHAETVKPQNAFSCECGVVIHKREGFLHHLDECNGEGPIEKTPEMLLPVENGTKKSLCSTPAQKITEKRPRLYLNPLNQSLQTARSKIETCPVVFESTSSVVTANVKTVEGGVKSTVGEVSIHINESYDQSMATVNLEYKGIPKDHQEYCNTCETSGAIVEELKRQINLFRTPFLTVIGDNTDWVLGKLPKVVQVSETHSTATESADVSVQSDNNAPKNISGVRCPFCPRHLDTFEDFFKHSKVYHTDAVLVMKNAMISHSSPCITTPIKVTNIPRTVPLVNKTISRIPNVAEIAKQPGMLLQNKENMPHNMLRDAGKLSETLERTVENKSRSILLKTCPKRKIGAHATGTTEVAPVTAPVIQTKTPINEAQFWDESYAKLESAQRGELDINSDRIENSNEKRPVRKPKRLLDEFEEEWLEEEVKADSEEDMYEAKYSPIKLETYQRSPPKRVVKKPKRWLLEDEESPPSKVSYKIILPSSEHSSIRISRVKSEAINSQAKCEEKDEISLLERLRYDSSMKKRKISCSKFEKNSDMTEEFASEKEVVEKTQMKYCAPCDTHFVDPDIFRLHLQTHQVDEKTQQCMECGKCFTVRPSLEKHLLAFHNIRGIPQYNSEPACKSIKSSNVTSSPEEGPLLENQCRICRKVCENEVEFKKHFRTHGMAFLRETKHDKTCRV